MNIEPTAKNAPEQFAGDVWVDSIAAPHEASQRMTVAIVKFAPDPAATTTWKAHVTDAELRGEVGA